MKPDSLTAEIIAIGTEILLGEITDTNSVYLAQVMRDLGINVFFMTSVGDNVDRIAEVIRHALNRSDLIITCGGLGPTVDDMTREGIAQATGKTLVFIPELLAQIEKRFESYRARMPENNKRQAYIPEGAIPVENPVGTAPSFITPYGEKLIITLPGVPRELKFLIKEQIIPYLMNQFKLGIIRAKNLRVAGIGESALDELIGVDLLSMSNPTIGLAAHHGVIDVRITAKASKLEDAEAMILDLEATVRERIGRYIFGVGKQDIDQVAFEALKEQQETLGIIEIGLEQGIVERLRQLVYAEDVLQYTVAYERQEVLENVEKDASSLAKALLQAILAHCDYGIVIISNPEVEESADINQSTVLVVGNKDSVHLRQYGFGAKSDLARPWLNRWSMAMIWQMTQRK